jgi:hypothetical protein
MRARNAMVILGPRPSGTAGYGIMPATYVISVRGHLGETILQAFPGLDAQVSGNCTLLRGVLPDQAALHGVFARIEALGLELVEVRQAPTGQ